MPNPEMAVVMTRPGRLGIPAGPAGARNVVCGAEDGDEELESDSHVENPQEISYDRE